MPARSCEESRDPYWARTTSVSDLASAPGSLLTGSSPPLQRGSLMDSGGEPIRGASAAAASDSAKERREMSLIKWARLGRLLPRGPADGRGTPTAERPARE